MTEFEKALLEELRQLRKQIRKLRKDVSETGDCFVNMAEYYRRKVHEEGK